MRFTILFGPFMRFGSLVTFFHNKYVFNNWSLVYTCASWNISIINQLVVVLSIKNLSSFMLVCNLGLVELSFLGLNDVAQCTIERSLFHNTLVWGNHLLEASSTLLFTHSNPTWFPPIRKEFAPNFKDNWDPWEKKFLSF